ncbi:MAG: signal peptide peptidase SppA [Candidatus Omnitrophota bacterium]|nr:signal peptide peptidase SppA [Candidatus Omnitrophota bacterium]
MKINLYKKINPWVALLIIILTVGGFCLGFFGGPRWVDDSEQETFVGNTEDCNIKIIPLTGALATYYDFTDSGYVYSDEIVSQIEDANKNEEIKAIVLEIDSYGGSPVAGEEILNALKNSSKETVALIRQAGLSAAYMAAIGANTIFASKFSDVGSIGVTTSYVDNVNKNKAEGLIFNQLSSGKYKDMMDPNKPLTEEEKALIMRDIELAHEKFVNLVAKHRKLSVEKVGQMADGSSMLGEMALKNGLIDKIGGINEVREYLKTELGIDPVICAEEAQY